MTREEAIKILKEDGCGWCTWQSTNPYECENEECKLKEALEMAIQALSQEPCSDAISREAVINIVKLRWDYYKNCIEAIEKLPSVTQKSGKWIKGKCSICGEHAPFWSMSTTYYESNYCPNCGAKMESEEQTE